MSDYFYDTFLEETQKQRYAFLKWSIAVDSLPVVALIIMFINLNNLLSFLESMNIWLAAFLTLGVTAAFVFVTIRLEEIIEDKIYKAALYASVEKEEDKTLYEWLIAYDDFHSSFYGKKASYDKTFTAWKKYVESK